MNARASFPYVLLALALIAGCGGRKASGPDSAIGGATGLQEDTAADQGSAGGGSGGASASVTTTGSVAGSAGATTASGGTGLGGSGGGTSSGPLGCRYQGKTYEVGERFMLPDGCNFCECIGYDTRIIECTNMNCASRSDGGTDAASGTCGDPAAKAAYAACRQSQDAATCSARGGFWRLEYNRHYGICVCLTGEGGCPCTASSDCLGDCSAYKDPFGGCQNVISFTCTSVGGGQGCWCRPEDPFTVCYP